MTNDGGASFYGQKQSKVPAAATPQHPPPPLPGGQSHFPEIGVACFLGVHTSLCLSHQAHLAHHTAQCEAVDVRELPLPPRLVGQLQRPRQDHVVRRREDGLRRLAVGLPLQRVVVDAVVDEQHTPLVACVLPKAVDAHRLRVHHADLALVELGQDGDLDSSAPGVVTPNPGAVVLVAAPQHSFGVGGGVTGHDLRDEAPHLWGAAWVVHTALHCVVDAGEEAGVVCGD